MRWPQAALLTRALGMRTAKSCGPDASTPASSLREAIFASDGDKKARSPRRARHKPSNHCAGKAGLLPLNLYARVRFFAQFCTRDRGCSAHPAFPAPSFRGGSFINTSGASHRESCTHVLKDQPARPSLQKVSSITINYCSKPPPKPPVTRANGDAVTSSTRQRRCCPHRRRRSAGHLNPSGDDPCPSVLHFSPPPPSVRWLCPPPSSRRSAR